ncbi:MAG: GUN4 domain-containing protein [Elainellaceae cyanobacterium]
MMRNRLERVQRDVLINVLAKSLAQQEEAVDRFEFLEQIVQVSELLIQQEDEYEFAHLSLQEYLASAYIAQDRGREKFLYRYLDDDWWKSAILLYVSQVNPTRLIQEALQQGLHDCAYICLQETTKRVDPGLKVELISLKQKVNTTRYSQLEEYLKGRQWKAADDETYRLMITSVRKEQGQSFSKDELLDFPCDELRTIDDLWLMYSGGRFGFSAQKDIYLSKAVGGASRDTYHNETFEKFVEKVGWGEVTGIKFDIHSPKGHLPLSWAQAFGSRRGLDFLFSRLQSCKASPMSH